MQEAKLIANTHDGEKYKASIDNLIEEGYEIQQVIEKGSYDLVLCNKVHKTGF